MIMNEDLPFVCAESSGVPILLCPAEIASHWEGTNKPSNGRIIEAKFDLNGPNGVHVDYDRACDTADDYVNIISIGPSNALIFGEEIPAMHWIKSNIFDGGYLVTWSYLPDGDEPNYQALTETLSTDFFTDTGFAATCSSEGFLLFPSTQAPADNNYFDFVKIDCSAGNYGAAIGFYETPDTSIRIIKIQRQDS